MWWLMFASAAACLIAWAWTGRYRPAAALFVLAYAANLYRPRHMPHWHTAWLIATGILLPLRLAMLVDAAAALLRPLKERWLLAWAVTSACAACVVILLMYVPLGPDFYSLVAARQYLQVAMALWMGLLLLGLLLLYDDSRWSRIDRHALVVFLVLADYAAASAFEEGSGLAAAFVVSTAVVRAAAKTIAAAVLALCFVGWAALAHETAKQVRGQRE
jgi:hypothetical protein